MLAFLRRNLTTVLVAMITAMVTAGAPAVAHGVHALFAHNADKVDGKHAVGGGASRSKRAGKLVATNSAGRLPDDIIAKAPDSALLQGRSLIEILEMANPPSPTMAPHAYDGPLYLALNGETVGPITQDSDCAVRGEVVKVTQTGISKKHLGTVKFGPCNIVFGANIHPAFLGWLDNSLALQYPIVDLAIVRPGPDGFRLNLNDALMEGLTVPQIDTAKDEGLFPIAHVAVEQITVVEGEQPGLEGAPVPYRTNLSSLDISAFPGAEGEFPGPSGATRFGPIETRIEFPTSTGETRDPTLSGAVHDSSAIEGVVPETAADQVATFSEWFHSFVIFGNNTDGDERQTALALRAANGAGLDLTFLGTGMVAWDRVRHADGARHFEMYTERTDLAL